MKIVENVKRRHFLIGSAGTMAAVAVGVPVMAQSGQEPLPEYVAWKDAKDMIVHSKQTLVFNGSGLQSAPRKDRS